MEANRDIVVVMPNWIGDSVMAIPTLRALRKRFCPERRLVGVMRPNVAGLFEGEPWFDEVLPHDRQGRRGALTLWQLARHFRARRPEAMVVLASSLRFGLLALVSGADRRVGFQRNLRGWMLTDPLQVAATRVDGQPTTLVDQYLELAYALGCEPESWHVELGVTKADLAGADLVWANSGFTPRHRVVAINPGGVQGTSRNWPAERFADLARRIVQESPELAVLVLCGPAERELAEHVVRQANHPLVRSMAAQDMRLGVTKAVVRRADLLVTGDHGLRHIAAGFATPVCLLEGPFDARKNFSGNPHETRTSIDLPCRPCNKHECPLGHLRCMTDLSLERVFAALQPALRPRPFVQVA